MAPDPAVLGQIAQHLWSASERSHQSGLLRDLRQRAQTALKRVERKTQAVRGDMERAAMAPRLRREADVLLCNLNQVARGRSGVTLLDESVEPPERLDIKLDPTLDARKNAEQRYQRARKLERGSAISQERLRAVEQELDRLRAFAAELERIANAGTAWDEQALSLQATELGLGTFSASTRKKRRETQSHSPYRTFVSEGRLILVGKGATDNDALTLTVARPHDHWVHARGTQGAHVIVPRERLASLDPELLLDAAHLAAHFSDFRGETSVEIQHTERRYLRKPKGAAPGLVLVDREKVLLLRIEPQRMARLLASERRSTAPH